MGGRNVPQVGAKESETNLYQELKVFTDVLAIVRSDYVENIDNQKLVEGAVKGMLSALDPHSGYLNPDFYKELQVETKGEFGGLGIEITVKDNMIVVVSPIEGSPAEKAGIKSGDAIVKIDGRFTKNLTLVDAVKQMRGAKGVPIVISVFRQGAPDLIDVTIIRDNIHVKSVRSRYLNDGLAYVKLTQFQESTGDDLINALKKIKKENNLDSIKGLILDLRNNPGGLLSQAIKVSDLFLNDGVIVYTESRIQSQKQKFFAVQRGTEPEYPLIVLVNGGSASASEIVAGALKDHGRALILGTTTFGKGSVQTIMPLENSGALRLTTALYYTKSGNSLQSRGVTPDLVVEIPTTSDEKGEKKTFELIRERDLPGAINNPDGKDVGEDKKTKEPIESLLERKNIETESLENLLSSDIQLQKAFELLKTFDIFKDIKKS